MKLLIRFCTPWGNYITTQIEIFDFSNYNDIKKSIETKFNIKPNQQLLKFKRDGFTMRIVENYPFSFYEIKEMSVLYVEKIETREEVSHSVNVSNITKKYYSRLGFYGAIKEEESEDTHYSSQGISSTKLEEELFTQPSSKEITNKKSGFLAELNTQKKNGFDVKKYFEGEIENLLKETKHGNLKEITHILSTFPENLPNNVLQEIKEKKKKLFNEIGNLKWNAVHFSVFSGNIEILKYFCENGADINKETEEGWTPLQLAIQKGHNPIIKLIINHDEIEINKQTKKGTALHTACSMNKGAVVSMLLNKNADPGIMNSEGYIPADLCTNEEIIKILNKEAKFTQISNSSSKKENDDENFEIHPLICGIIYKVGDAFITLYERYYVLNIDNGTFIRYRSKKDCPNRPSEIVPLRDISYIKRISDSWYMRANFHYFEIGYNSSKQILACKFKSTVNLWIKHIFEAFQISQKIEERLQKINETADFNKLSSFSTKLAEEEPTYILIDDTKKENQEGNDEIKNGFSLENSPEIKGSNKTKPQKSSKKTNSKFQNQRNNESVPTNDSPTKEESHLSLDENQTVNFKSFQILKIIGSGAFGKIFLVKKKDTHKIYAMKALKKKELIQKRQLIYAVTEANVLKKVQHPFIVQLHYAFQTPGYLYFVMDYCSGGDLSLHLAKSGCFTEEVSKFYIAELILAIEYLHKLNILYRDMKPENILLDAEGHVKLADFGLAKENVGIKDHARSFCGSPAYLPPEILGNKGSTHASDIYGIGAVLYEFLAGNPPYYDYDLMKMYRSIEAGKLSFPDNVSSIAKKLLKKMLNKDPTQRIEISEIKGDEFFHGIDWEKIEKKEYEAPFFDEDIEDELAPFDRHICHEDLDYDVSNKKMNRVIRFTFSKKEDI